MPKQGQALLSEPYEVDIRSLPVASDDQAETLPEKVDRTKQLAIAQKDREARNRLLDELGLDAESVVRAHAENLKAVTYMQVGMGKKRKLVAVPDFKTRQKAVADAETLLGLKPSDDMGDSGRPVILALSPETKAKAERAWGQPIHVIDVTSEPLDETEIDDDGQPTSEFGREDDAGRGDGPEEAVEDAQVAPGTWDAECSNGAGGFGAETSEPGERREPSPGASPEFDFE